MKLMIYCELQESTLQQNLGRADYSYFLVAKIFAPVLRKFGDVVFVAGPAEADAIAAQAQQDNEPCLLLCFTPPHRALLPRYPAVAVFAWEYADLPTEQWDDDARTDWRHVLRHHGHAICHSTYSADVVRKAMGDGFPVFAIPAPVYEKFSSYRKTLAEPATLFAERRLHLRGNVIDSRDYHFRNDSVEFHPGAGYIALRPWDRQSVTLNFAHQQEGSGLLDGFYLSEPWGTWSRASTPGIFLPFLLSGKCRLQLRLAAHGANVGREIFLEAGQQKIVFRPTGEFATHDFVLDLRQPISRIRIGGLETRATQRLPDQRSLGVGVCSLQIDDLQNQPAATQTENDTGDTVAVTLHGVVYTSVLNPDDGRKNWQDIVTAFCHALRDADDATLVIKAVHHSMVSYLATFNHLMQGIGPMRCRVIVLHGYLDDADYRGLIDASTYYVNASLCEGGCLPLVEFISTGTPAIAPDNTAMRDYITPESTFVVKSAPVCTNWPHDPRFVMRTSYYRIDWESLTTQFRSSYDLVRNDPATWKAMGIRAAGDVRKFYGGEVVEASLQRFLQSAFKTAPLASGTDS
jgi:glycosyltransferase involved in cell wall biosynthesis